jgi:hypothetical protein
MAIRRKAEEAGVFNPSEVALLGRVSIGSRSKGNPSSDVNRLPRASSQISRLELRMRKSWVQHRSCRLADRDGTIAGWSRCRC